MKGVKNLEIKTPVVTQAGKAFTVKIIAKTAEGHVFKGLVASVKVSSRDPKLKSRGPASISSKGSSAIAYASIAATDNGQTQTDLSLQTVGDQTVVVDFTPKDGTTQTVMQTVTVTPGNPTRFIIVYKEVFPAGTFSPVVYAMDDYDNIVLSVSGSASLQAFSDSNCSSAAGGSSLDSVDSAPFVSGMASFPKITFKSGDSVYFKVVQSGGGSASGVATLCGAGSSLTSAQQATISNNGTTLPAWNTTISGITPNASQFQGGATLTVTGSNFRTSATVKLGTVPCTVTAATNTQITCSVQSAYATYPGVSTQAVDVVVSNTDGSYATLSSSFTYYVPRTCQMIYSYGNSTGNGIYKIRPKDADAAPGYDALCDMSDGGWTLVGREASGQSGNLLHLGSDIAGGDETNFSGESVNGVMGSRFEAAAAGTRLYSDVKITSAGDITKFTLANAGLVFFEDTRNLDISITNFSTTNSNLSTWTTAGGGAKFCRAAYTGHAAWDLSTADGSTLDLLAVPNPTYPISNAWATIGYAQTGWGIKPISDNSSGRYVVGTHTQDVTNGNWNLNGATLSPTPEAYSPVATGSVAACSGNITGVPNNTASHYVCTSVVQWCDNWWEMYASAPCTTATANFDTFLGCNGPFILPPFWSWSNSHCACNGGYNECDQYNDVFRWTIPDTTLTPSEYLGNGVGGTGGGGCTSGANVGQGYFYGGVMGGGLLGASDNAQSKTAIVTPADTEIWIK